MGVHALAVVPSNPATENLASAVERPKFVQFVDKPINLAAKTPPTTDGTNATEAVEIVAPPTRGDTTEQARHIKAWNKVLSGAIAKVANGDLQIVNVLNIR
ncbi:hypothetical protein ABVK25_001734 [Lepraria finkii]|uniref:Uncharacterized protein n=1 Tax=Lepraria finkii TaxID=1340010 RepID=A0ABR4BM62_9LECA